MGGADRSWLDRQTGIDNLIAKQTTVLERIETALINVGAISPRFEGDWLRQLFELQKAREERETEIVFFTYPPEGVTATLAIGTTIIDFEAGTVTTPSDVVSDMKHSLQSEGKSFLRSFYVNTNKAVAIQLDAKDKIYAEEEKDVIGTYQQFKRMRITTTESTALFVLCCTNPEAILQLIDKPSLVAGGNRMVYGSVVDIDGTGTQFEGVAGGGSAGSDALGDTPVSYVQLYPTTVSKFRLEDVKYYCNPTNAVTYQLYIFEQASAENVQNLADMVFDSLAARVDSKSYVAVDLNQLPINVKLADVGKLYYLIEWTGDPGNCPGYLVIRGEVMV